MFRLSGRSSRSLPKESYLESKTISKSPPPAMPEVTTVELHRLLSPQRIKLRLRAKDKTDLLNKMVDLLKDAPEVIDLEAVRKAIFEREEMMSTGVGKGLALPHAKTPAVSDTMVALATLEEPVDFDAIDNEPVQIVFLLVGPPEARSLHIRLLSRISRLMNRQAFREQLLKAETPADVIRLFKEFEEQLT